MKNYFTFGTNHRDVLGRSLGSCYVCLEGGFHETRQQIFDVRGGLWAFQYNDELEFARIVRQYRLVQVTLDQVALPAVRVRLNPLGHYDNREIEDLLSMVGLLPAFARERKPEEELEVAMLKAYGQASGNIEGFQVDYQQALHYEGDPVLYPVAVLEARDGQQCYIYPYGLVRFVSSGRVYRMD